MLQNPRWDIDERSTFIAWLAKQPPTKQYDFWQVKGPCLIDHYIRDHGMEPTIDSYVAFADKHADLVTIAFVWPHTYGAALERVCV